MKTKSLVTLATIVKAILASCGPIVEQKQMMANIEQKAQNKKIEDEYRLSCEHHGILNYRWFQFVFPEIYRNR